MKRNDIPLSYKCSEQIELTVLVQIFNRLDLNKVLILRIKNLEDIN